MYTKKQLEEMSFADIKEIGLKFGTTDRSKAKLIEEILALQPKEMIASEPKIIPKTNDIVCEVCGGKMFKKKEDPRYIDYQCYKCPAHKSIFR